MKSGQTLTVISLGGGVQFPDRSRGQPSVMALMASERDYDRTPDCAIFVDTLWEPPSVYKHIEWLKVQLRFPLYVVDNSLTRARHGGRSLREDVKSLTNHSGSRSYVDIPVYPKGRNGEINGIRMRQCTAKCKIRPIRSKIRELLGPRKGRRVPSGTMVELWLGISTDEAVHTKNSHVKWMANRHPLIETGKSRQDCIDWWTARYDRPLERSACVACPFQSRQRWVETKHRWPELFAEAVETDAKMRDGLAFAKEPYLHSLRMPLDEAVALDEAKLGGEGQGDGFGNECEGHCGV